MLPFLDVNNPVENENRKLLQQCPPKEVDFAEKDFIDYPLGSRVNSIRSNFSYEMKLELQNDSGA